MNYADLPALLPFLVLATTSLAIMLGIAFFRSHKLTFLLTLFGLAIALAGLFFANNSGSGSVTPLLTIDNFARYYIGLILLAGILVSLLSYSYLNIKGSHAEEFYILLVLATLGCMVLAAATHFASFFLGLELLSVSLYALAAYLRHSERGIEAGVKYLILAAVSSAFILFGMALIYAETGSMELAKIAVASADPGMNNLAFLAGSVLIIVGVGFKLAVVPFHLWTPDVYEGAPAPVTAFIATVSKGAVFALVLRFFGALDIHVHAGLFTIFTIIAVSSMFAGNLLALLQTNVKRILAYSSISHIGYLLVTLLASGPLAKSAAAFYLTAYFITTLGAFGVVTILSNKDRDADLMEDYRGLAGKRPWLAGVLTLMLFSLAGIPLTAGFIGKFYVVTAGVGSSLWFVVIALVINSVIGLYYYLRIVIALFARPSEGNVARQSSLSARIALAGLTFALILLGVYPGPVLDLITTSIQGLN